jgi:hypothetical protein
MKAYVYYNFSKKIFLGTLQFKKYYNDDIFELFYEEGEIITILCKEDEIYFTVEEINKILEMKKEIYENNYNCYIDNYRKTFIYKNDEKYEYDKWLYNINKNFIF